MKTATMILLALVLTVVIGCGGNYSYHPKMIVLSPNPGVLQEELDARLNIPFRHVTFFWAFEPRDPELYPWYSYTVHRDNVAALIDSVAAVHLNPMRGNRRLVGVNIGEPILENTDYGMKELGWVNTWMWHRN